MVATLVFSIGCVPSRLVCGREEVGQLQRGKRGNAHCTLEELVEVGLIDKFVTVPMNNTAKLVRDSTGQLVPQRGGDMAIEEAGQVY